MSLVIGPLNEADLDDADSIFRLSFARFYGLADPAQMFGDIDYVRTRWRTAPNAAFGAFLGGRLIGSNFAVRWGSVGFIGPLTLHPDYWGRGFSPRLIQATLDLLAVWGVEAVGLFTFPQSPLHLHLYQKFDFWPRFLTVILTRPAESPQPQVAGAFDLSESDSDCKQVFREFADAIYPGLDLGRNRRRAAAGVGPGRYTPRQRHARRYGDLSLRAGYRGGQRDLLRKVRRRPTGSGRRFPVRQFTRCLQLVSIRPRAEPYRPRD